MGVIIRPSYLSVLVSFRRFWHNDPGGLQSLPSIHALREGAGLPPYRNTLEADAPMPSARKPQSSLAVEGELPEGG